MHLLLVPIKRVRGDNAALDSLAETQRLTIGAIGKTGWSDNEQAFS